MFKHDSEVHNEFNTISNSPQMVLLKARTAGKVGQNWAVLGFRMAEKPLSQLTCHICP